MHITPRDEWNARAPRSRVTVKASRRRFFVVHHSGGPVTQTVRAIQDWCMDGRGFADIDYNFLVRADTGEIYEGRGWNVIGSHTLGFNTEGIGVCVIGDNADLSDQARIALLWLRDEADRRCERTLMVRGHGSLTETDCPGSKLNGYITAGMPAPEEEEMTDEDMRKLAGYIAEAIMGTPVKVGEEDWKLSTAVGYQTRKLFEIDKNTQPRG